MGADVQVVADGMGLDSRIGSSFLRAGIGFGGSCFPKDTTALLSVAKEYGGEALIVEAVVEVNRAQRLRMVEKIERLAGGDLAGRQVAVLGLSFKPETDDMREAPSVEIVRALTAKGARVRAYDPVAAEQARKVLPEVEYAPDEYEAAAGADVLVFMTEWNQFRALDMQKIRGLMRAPRVADLRNIYEPQRMRDLGFDYVGVGR